jgi:hypothetical protein
MGDLKVVRFDMARDGMAAGEGIETVLSLRCVTPAVRVKRPIPAVWTNANPLTDHQNHSLAVSPFRSAPRIRTPSPVAHLDSDAKPSAVLERIPAVQDSVISVPPRVS